MQVVLQGLAPRAVASIAMRLHAQPVSEQYVVTRQGDHGQSIYSIARSVVRLSKETAGKHDAATFLAGDFLVRMRCSPASITAQP